MDSLVEIARNDLHEIKNLLELSSPYGVEGCSIITTQLTWPTLSDIFNFKFYSPGGDISLGMVAVSDQEKNYEVYLCPTSAKGLYAIEDALINTNVIDWNREVLVLSVNEEVLGCLKRVSNKISLKINFQNDYITYDSKICKMLRHRNAKVYEDLKPPENTYVGLLKREHLDLINGKWPFYNGEHSYKILEALMLQGLIYVLYSSEDHQPLSWIAIDKAGILTALHCVETHRRKGYAEYITKVFINELCKGKDVLTYTLFENKKSYNLMAKLDFELVEYVWWVFLTKCK